MLAAKLSAEAIINETSITVVDKDIRNPNSGAACVCPFDTYTKVPDIKMEPIAVKYHKTSSVLDLKQGKGSIVLDSMDFGYCR